ncbi:hypothetical protein BCR44DRAFT_279275 [Catenaria anguillulae PL171]|uniref:Uncharacterized protein n=1 Tax=Catenaria anguillulae PL171 TaxID=765915 RepID=A0A1Y2HN49_9FUNG|nr:hypothetical protein BCR44DRAFT_279275 [Catenaria anguillulae PL171]
MNGTCPSNPAVVLRAVVGRSGQTFSTRSRHLSSHSSSLTESCPGHSLTTRGRREEVQAMVVTVATAVVGMVGKAVTGIAGLVCMERTTAMTRLVLGCHMALSHSNPPSPLVVPHDFQQQPIRKQLHQRLQRTRPRPPCPISSSHHPAPEMPLTLPQSSRSIYRRRPKPSRTFLLRPWTTATTRTR